MPIPPTFLCSSLFKDGFLGNRHAYFLFISLGAICRVRYAISSGAVGSLFVFVTANVKRAKRLLGVLCSSAVCKE